MYSESEQLRAVYERDSSCDGAFYYAVRTTGIVCNPSCPAKKAAPRNILFFRSLQAALAQGFRPCKRCRPESRPLIEAVIFDMCRIFENSPEALDSEEAIASKAGYSATHFRAAFSRTVGCSPKSYRDAVRKKRLRQALREMRSVGEAIYEAGYGSSSRVYESAAATLGMTPRAYKKGGAHMTVHYATASSRIGPMLIAATERGICCLQFGASEEKLVRGLRTEFPNADILPMPSSNQPVFEAWMRAVDAYLQGKQHLQSLPLDIRGTAFQELVWKFLQTIPVGQTRSYTQVAAGIGRPAAVRAVAGACASNRIALCIPCHRVIRGDGTLSGYRWGVGIKEDLLELEARSEARPGRMSDD